MKVNFLHLFLIIALEVACFYLIQVGYAIFSMLIFGAGAGSFMYAKANEIILVGLSIIPLTIFNSYKIQKHWKNFHPKSINYLLVEFLLVLVIISFNLITA